MNLFLCFYCTWAYSTAFGWVWKNSVVAPPWEIHVFWLRSVRMGISKTGYDRFSIYFIFGLVSTHETQYFGRYLDFKWFSSVTPTVSVCTSVKKRFFGKNYEISNEVILENSQKWIKLSQIKKLTFFSCIIFLKIFFLLKSEYRNPSPSVPAVRHYFRCILFKFNIV
jgi:hypothetical protein